MYSNSFKTTVICLTKSYNLADFSAWLMYHYFYFDRVIILDNESEVDIQTECKKYPRVEYKKIEGWANQWKLFSDILNLKTDIEFSEGEYVMFLDDDEYLYESSHNDFINRKIMADFKPTGYNIRQRRFISETIDDSFGQLDCLLLPEILMAPKFLPETRDTILPAHNVYAVSEYSSQGKAIIRWSPGNKYDFRKGKKEIGHVPWVNGIRMSDVVGSGVSKTTYGLQPHPWAPKSPVKPALLFLFHYHIKSMADWNKKIERGSAATKNDTRKNGTYDDDITKNSKYHWNKDWFNKTTNLIYWPHVQFELDEINKKMLEVPDGKIIF